MGVTKRAVRKKTLRPSGVSDAIIGVVSGPGDRGGGGIQFVCPENWIDLTRAKRKLGN